MTLSIFDAAREEPRRLALVASGLDLSYAALAARVERRLAELHAAQSLDPHGWRPVAVVARPRLETAVTILALFAAGTPVLVLHSRATASERDALMQRSGAVPEPPSADPKNKQAHSARALPALGAFGPERIAAIVPTSGSTGAPRLVQLSHRAFLAAGAAAIAQFGLADDFRWQLTLPLAHIGGLCVLARSLVMRRATVLFEPRRSLLHELPRFVEEADGHQITVASLVPTLLERLVAPPIAWRPPPSLRAVLLGGAAIPRGLIAKARAAGIPVMPTYGMTESCSQAVTCAYTDRLSPVPEGPDLFPCGRAITGVDFRIQDGLIELRGRTLFSGYLGEPDSDPHEGWFRTHDRGHLDAHGELVVTGRASDVIITGGENVDPLEVEAALGALPGIESAYVFGVPDATFGEVIGALLVLRSGGSPTAETLTDQLKSRLAPFKHPRRVTVVRELPLTASGKLDRHAARRLQASPPAT